ncbi:transglycosylase family protein [Streptomyces sp. NWU339]|uniref:transglycosylase family protein n=1 Tax=Streptomyces sp. NWU339 TaxID=2185284 RepID=UPI002810BB56|nr:transglycosylase family protein [Streptomyces sp. NWU339]
MTGSAIAIPLLGASGASAAEGSTWNRVAECESGGSWSQNSGNGYYGGLQLTQEDWEKYGGLDYASSADQASRGQQIAVAEKILADQGVGAWRACGLLSGLSADSGKSVIDTGADGGSSYDSSGTGSSTTPSPSQSSDASSGNKGNKGAEGDKGQEAGEASESGDSGAEPGTSPSASASPSASTPVKGDDSDKSGQKVGSSDTSASEAPTGRHRGASAEEEVREDRESGASGRHASRGGLGFSRGLDVSSPADRAPAGAGSDSSVVSDSLALGGWLAQYGGGGEGAGAAGSSPILPGQALAFGFGSAEG